MGLPIGQALSGGGQFPDYDLNLLAEMLGVTYNPSQGYPNKIVPDQVMDIYGPTPDYLLPQLYNIQNPDAGGFDLDAFFGADPLLRGPLAQAYSQAGGDPIEMFNYLQSNEPTTEGGPGFRDQLLGEIGRTEWDELVGRGDLRSIAAITGEEKDEAALDFYMRGLEDLLATGAPTSQKAISELDFTRQREGFRPGPGTGEQYPEFEGAGFGGGGDVVSALAQQPQYQDINLEATPQGTPFGEGITEVGFDEGPDRIDYEDGARFATIGGRRFALPDTMVGPFGTNPEYMRALRAINVEKRRRQFEPEPRDQRRSDRSSRGILSRGASNVATGDTPLHRLLRLQNPFG